MLYFAFTLCFASIPRMSFPLLQEVEEVEGGQVVSGAATPGTDFSVAEVLTDVQGISLVVKESEAIRSELKLQQSEELYKRLVRPNNPTRFAGLLLLAKDVIKITGPIMGMVHGAKWRQLRKSSVNANVFEKLTMGWWKSLALVIELMTPISDAIHRLEADAPYLSQVLLIWMDLESHAKQWAVKVVEEGCPRHGGAPKRL
ncbi:hypothetical protein V8C86DRAFT_275304 [Haematococcus lacustris]